MSTLVGSVKAQFTAEDKTGAASESAKKNIKGVGDSAKKSESVFAGASKAMAGMFAVEKILQFGKEALRLATVQNPKLGESLTKVGDQFRGIQAQVGAAILGNEDLMQAVSFLADVLGTVLVKAIQIVSNQIRQLVIGFKMIVEGAKLAWGFLKGQDISEQQASLKQLGQEFVDVYKDTFKVVTTWDKVKPMKAETKAIKEGKDALLERVALMESLANVIRLSIPEQMSLRTLDSQLTVELAKGNLTLERRVDLLKAQQTVTELIQKTKPSFQTGLTATGQAKRPDAGLGMDRLQIKPPTLGDGQGNPISMFKIALDEATSPLDEFKNSTMELDELLGQMAGNSLVNFTDAFAVAFEGIGQGANVFKSLANAAKQTISQTAAFLGREQIAKAAASFAEGIWPPNPAAFAKGAKHLGAAALFFGLAGASGGSGGRGGGGTSGAIQQRDNVVNTNKMEPREINVYIKGGSILNVADPRQQADFANLMKTITGQRTNIFATS